jgi:hypothetical protein
MKALLHTTIGPVLTETSGHYIEIYTAEESYREGLLNLWDYEKGKMTIEPGLRDLVRLVAEDLSYYFEEFEVFEITEIEATLEQVMK